MHGDSERFLAEGFDGYVSKPVNVRELIEIVRQHCEGRRMSGDATTSSWTMSPQNVRLLEAVLVSQGWTWCPRTMAKARSRSSPRRSRLVLLDVMMPPPDGYEVCRRLREVEETAVLPVIMVTASTTEKTKAIRGGRRRSDREAVQPRRAPGPGPVPPRIKRYHDTIAAQSAELLELNRTLEDRVEAQVLELEQTRKLRRFPRRNSPTPSFPAVTTRSCAAIAERLDALRGPPRLDELRRRGRPRGADAGAPRVPPTRSGVSSAVRRDRGVPEGDGVQLFFNDPHEVPDGPLRAVRLACALREEMAT